MFNFIFRPYVPGFRVRPQDDVPGFNIDENGLPRRETTWPDEMRPGPATPQYPDLAQAMMPTPSPAASVQPALPTGLPGFRVRPQDDVPGFNVDENGLPQRDST